MAPRKAKSTPNASLPARQTRASSRANNTPLMQGLDDRGQVPGSAPAPARSKPARQTRAKSKAKNTAQNPAPAPAPIPAPAANPSQPARRQTRASSKANNTPLVQGLNSQGQAQGAPSAAPAPAPAPVPAPVPAPAPQPSPAAPRARAVPEAPLRQTRARSKLNNAPPLMNGLDDRGEARDPLSADPAPLPFDDVLEGLGRGRSSASRANNKRRRAHKVAVRTPSPAPAPAPVYVPGSIPVQMPELIAETPVSPDHGWPTVDWPIPPGSSILWYGPPPGSAVANNEGNAQGTVAQGTVAGDDQNQDANAIDSDSDMDDMEDIPARPKIKVPATYGRNRAVEEEEEEEDSDLSDLPETPETPSHFGSSGSDSSGQSPNDDSMAIAIDYEEWEGFPDSPGSPEPPSPAGPAGPPSPDASGQPPNNNDMAIAFDFEEREGLADSPEPPSPPGRLDSPDRLDSPSPVDSLSYFGSSGPDASGQPPNDDDMIISFQFEAPEGSPDSLTTIEIELEDDEEDRPDQSDSQGSDHDGSASEGGAGGDDALDEGPRGFTPSNSSSPDSTPDRYRRGSAFTPINAHWIAHPQTRHSLAPDGTSLYIRGPIAPVAPMGLTSQSQSPSVNASVVLMESDPDDDGPDDDDDPGDDDGPDDDSSTSTSSASTKSEDDDDKMDQTADTSLNTPHNCSNGSVKRRRDTDDDGDGNASPAKRQKSESVTPSPYKKATQSTAPHDPSYSPSKSYNYSDKEDDNDDWARKLGLLQSRRSSSDLLSPLIKPTIDPEMPGLYGSALRPRLHISWYEQYHVCGYDCPKVHPCKHNPGRPCHQCHSQWHEDWSMYFKCQEILDEAAADPLTSMREAGLETHPDFKKYFEPGAPPCYVEAPQLDHPVGNSIRAHPTRIAKYKLDLMKAKMAIEAEEAA